MELTVRAGALHSAAGDLDTEVDTQVREVAKQLAAAEGAPGAAHMGTMVSADLARACIEYWHESFLNASNAMNALSGKLRRTDGLVGRTDLDAAELYEGVVPELPTISVNITE